MALAHRLKSRPSCEGGYISSDITVAKKQNDDI